MSRVFRIYAQVRHLKHTAPPNNEATDVKNKQLSRKIEVGDGAETSTEGNKACYNEYLISCRLSVIGALTPEASLHVNLLNYMDLEHKVARQKLAYNFFNHIYHQSQSEKNLPLNVSKLHNI